MKTSMYGLQMAIALVVVISSAAEAPAQEGGFGDEAEGDYKLMTYPVGDLIMEVPDYPYPDSQNAATRPSFGGGGFGGGGGGLGGGGGAFSVPEEPAAGSPMNVTFADLLRVIVQVVSPTTWAENGGAGEVQQLGTTLVVWQTTEVHQQIRDLLHQLRAGAGDRRTVTIDARWVLLNSDELESLLQKEGQHEAALVDRAALAEFTRRPSSMRGVTNCFSGQLVYVVSGTKQNFVSGFVPVVGSIDNSPGVERLVSQSRGATPFKMVADTKVIREAQGTSVGYQPIVERRNLGALLEIRPTVMNDQEQVVVNLTSTLTFPGELSEVVRPGAAPGAPNIDRVAVQSQQLATTLRIPLSAPVLVGGMTRAGLEREPPALDEEDDEDSAPERRQRYLVLEVR